jgi:uncharacterized membrane protein YfcA
MGKFGTAIRVLLIVMGAGLLYVTFVADAGLAGAYRGDVSLGAWVAVAAMACVCEYVDSSLGMGYGTTLTPLLLIVGFEPLQVVPAVLISQLVAGLLAGALHHRLGNVSFTRRGADTRIMAALAASGIAGASIAVLVALQISKICMKVWIGVLVLAIGIFVLWSPKALAKFSWGKIIGLGLVAAFNKGMSGGGYGPLTTGGQIVAGVKAKNAVGITSLAEALTCVVAVVLYLVLQKGGFYWPLAMSLMAGAVLSVPFATWTVKRMPLPAMTRLIGYATVFLGTLTLVKVVVG